MSVNPVNPALLVSKIKSAVGDMAEALDELAKEEEQLALDEAKLRKILEELKIYDAIQERRQKVAGLKEVARDAEEDIRELAILFFEHTGDKDPLDGIVVCEREKVQVVAWDTAMDYTQEHAPDLVKRSWSDKRKFDAFWRRREDEDPDALPGVVEIQRSQFVRLSKDKAIAAVAEDAEPADEDEDEIPF